jgi:hypothetical protein
MRNSNNIRQIVKAQGRTLVWLADKISTPEKPISRALMNKYVNEDRFEDWQRVTMAELLGVSVADLFPEAVEEVPA